LLELNKIHNNEICIPKLQQYGWVEGGDKREIQLNIT